MEIVIILSVIINILSYINLALIIVLLKYYKNYINTVSNIVVKLQYIIKRIFCVCEVYESYTDYENVIVEKWITRLYMVT